MFFECWTLLSFDKKLCTLIPSAKVQICMTIKLLQIVGGAQQLAVLSWFWRFEGLTWPCTLLKFDMAPDK